MAAPSEGVRGYLRELRMRLGITQKDFAEAIGLSHRALVDWEGARTDDLKGTQLVRAVSFLHASFDDIRALIETSASEDEGRARAIAWLSQQDSDQIDRMVADDDDSLIAAIQEMRVELDRLHDRVARRARSESVPNVSQPHSESS